ncbi:metallophosphoesterase [Methylobacterium aerolatum]|uniref:Metallophosphoesterase n=1 Tax=Methylobacterium aerolatum TaxID=418708 RepID=A0ABU0HXM3_9HYPH|nr:metallophosphoesterase [Methylobacterium aerolatum]MDQ0447061.1 hypothetical protein [Methylobacterium aerolatum]GJD37222.1 hypothetical protein FMGBMHLM_4149 [Methylobacterium aerolatum]
MNRPFRVGRSADRTEAERVGRWHAPGLLAGLIAGPSAPCPGRAPPRRFWVMSDLRLDRDPLPALTPPPDIDAVLVAGNVAEGIPEAVRLLDRALGDRGGGRPVFLVPGNVEYRSDVPMGEALARGREAAAAAGIDLLSDQTARVGPPHGDGLVVVGATLWTDWQLRASPERPRARIAARNSWEDAGRIELRRGRRLTPLDSLAMHARSRAYVEDALLSVVIGSLGLPNGPNACTDVARPGDAAVVLTCHAPTPLSLPQDWAGWHADAWVAASLASEAAEAMEAWGAPRLWAHGNVPRGADHVVGRTRVVANPRVGERGHAFDPALVVTA